MSNEGTGGAFVNSHGYVHDMITLHRATNATYEGEPETEHSWFPGYAWTIAYCAGCTSHLVRASHGLHYIFLGRCLCGSYQQDLSVYEQLCCSVSLA